MPHRIGCCFMTMLIVACSNEGAREGAAQGGVRKDASSIDACGLLTLEEIEQAAGWRPEAADPETHQRTATCNYHRANGAKVQSVVLVVSPSTRALATSQAMADWRSEQVARYPELKITIAPVEGLGVPAVSSQTEGDDGSSLELWAKGLLLSLRSPSLEVSKALAPKAVARLP